MKKIISIVSLMAVLCMSCVPALAETNAAQTLENALKGVKAAFEPAFSLPNDDPNKQTPDMWYLYPLCATDNIENEDYAFLKPTYTIDNPTEAASNALMKSVLSDILSSKKPIEAQVKALASKQGENGSFQNTYGYDSASETAYAAIALELAGDSGIKADYNKDMLLSYLGSAQKPDGGFNDYGAEGNVDTTGMVMSALNIIGGSDAAAIMKKCVAYLRTTLAADGSLVGKGQYDSANSCSQSMGIIGLIAAGEDLENGEFSKVDDKLFSYVADNGCFWYDEASMSGQGWYAAPDMFSTYQGMMALSDIKTGGLFKALSDKLKAQSAPVTTTATVSAATTTAALGTATDIPSDPRKDNVNTGVLGMHPAILITLGMAAVVIASMTLWTVCRRR